MRRLVWRQLPFMAFVALAAVSVSCTRHHEEWTTVTPTADSAGTPVRVVGTVKHLAVEGGVFTVQGEDGVTYNPLNLPTEFQREGLAIEIEGRRRDDTMSIQMVGPMLQVIRVRLRTP
ncbi:MAG: hypothetical protein U0132_22245 [Gemmatimonadaceae bacterium]